MLHKSDNLFHQTKLKAPNKMVEPSMPTLLRRSTRTRNPVNRLISEEVALKTKSSKPRPAKKTIKTKQSSSKSKSDSVPVKKPKKGNKISINDTFEKDDVNIPNELIHPRVVLWETTVKYYRRVASYYPEPIPSLKTLFRPHQYYMNSLNFQGRANLIVFCESHANTPNVGDVICNTSKVPEWFGYVNLVHCVPYGESHLLSGGRLDELSPSERAGMKNGTIQFWKLLSVLAGFQDEQCNKGGSDPLDSNDCFDFLKSRANRDDRIAAKNRILQGLKSRRIALVDASPFPIYHGSYRETSYNQKTGTPYWSPMNPLKKAGLEGMHLKVSWEYYAKPLISHFRPRNILILSRGLGEIAEQDGVHGFLRDNGGQYLGARIHPSSTIKTEVRLLELKEVRSVTNKCLHAQ